MRKFKNLVIGGIESKIFNLIIITLAIVAVAVVAIAMYQRDMLTSLTAETSLKQQKKTSEIISETMSTVTRKSMERNTEMEAQISDEMFRDISARVQMVADYATKIFAEPDSYLPQAYTGPDVSKDGVLFAQIIWADGTDPEDPEIAARAGLVSNLSGMMISLCDAMDSDNIYVGMPEGFFLSVNRTSSQWLEEDGKVKSYDARERFWYRQAAEAGGLVFSDLEVDANTGELSVVCAMPVYGPDGKLAAVVGSDLFLHAMEETVRGFVSDGGYVWIVNQSGHVIYSPNQDLLRLNESRNAPDLRESENTELASLVREAMEGKSDVSVLDVNGNEYYMLGVPIDTVGWTLFSAFPKETVDQVESTLITTYDQITEDARSSYRRRNRESMISSVILMLLLTAAAAAVAIFLGKRITKPLNTITERIAELKGEDLEFKMEDTYRTGDEIEVLAESFADLSHRALDYVEQVKTATAEKERISTELHMAKRIQESMLPHLFPPFPDRKEFDLYATMNPARDVGGDFYDFFLVDPDHLCLVMADVSGKGIPAALFMMISKTILQNCAMLGKSAGTVLEKTNEALCSNNQTEMFVTVWIGILEISTGRLTCSNAGHEYPVMYTKDGGGEFALVKDRHGFVVGGMECTKYKEYELQMKPGDKLFVYTDGVPEATDCRGKMFTTEQMVETLNTVKNGSPEEVLETVQGAVSKFVGEAEQFDDLTMLCLEYKGPDETEKG